MPAPRTSSPRATSGIEAFISSSPASPWRQRGTPSHTSAVYTAGDAHAYVVASRFSNLSGAIAMALVPWLVQGYFAAGSRIATAIISAMYLLAAAVDEYVSFAPTNPPAADPRGRGERRRRFTGCPPYRCRCGSSGPAHRWSSSTSPSCLHAGDSVGGRCRRMRSSRASWCCCWPWAATCSCWQAGWTRCFGELGAECAGAGHDVLFHAAAA
jgi:hypothetical protein